MESSSEGRLGLQQVFPQNFLWKGKTFSEVTSLIRKNNNLDQNHYDHSIFFKSQPLKHYRREVANIDNVSNSRISSTIKSFETPGGAILLDPNSSLYCAGNASTKDIAYNDTNQSANPCSACDVPLEGAIDSTFVRSLSAQENARRRVRSSGMSRTKYMENKNNSKNFFSSSSQYLHGRNKTFQQNQFNNLRIEGTHSSENVYASNTPQTCGGTDANGNPGYVPVYYKPNNAKFAQQGGVSASTRLVQLKYNTITDGGASMAKVYGNHTANALAYNVPGNGYTIKDKIGYPNTCSLKFTSAHPNGIKTKCA